MSLIFEMVARLEMDKSHPVVGPVAFGLRHHLPSLPVLVAQVVPHGVHFGSQAEQVAVVAIGLEVLEGEQESVAQQQHPLPHLLVGV